MIVRAVSVARPQTIDFVLAQIVPTVCDSRRGGTWVRKKLVRMLTRSQHSRRRLSQLSRFAPSGASRITEIIGAAWRSAKLIAGPASQGASSINSDNANRLTSAFGKAAAIRCSSIKGRPSRVIGGSKLSARSPPRPHALRGQESLQQVLWHELGQCPPLRRRRRCPHPPAPLLPHSGSVRRRPAPARLQDRARRRQSDCAPPGPYTPGASY